MHIPIKPKSTYGQENIVSTLPAAFEAPPNSSKPTPI